jgi:hypothetical protein
LGCGFRRSLAMTQRLRRVGGTRMVRIMARPAGPMGGCPGAGDGIAAPSGPMKIWLGPRFGHAGGLQFLESDRAPPAGISQGMMGSTENLLRRVRIPRSFIFRRPSGYNLPPLLCWPILAVHKSNAPQRPPSGVTPNPRRRRSLRDRNLGIGRTVSGDRWLNALKAGHEVLTAGIDQELLVADVRYGFLPTENTPFFRGVGPVRGAPYVQRVNSSPRSSAGPALEIQTAPVPGRPGRSRPCRSARRAR